MVINILILMSAVGVIALLAAKMPDIIALFSEKAAHDVAYDRFMENCRDQGLDYHGSMDQWRVREEFARYRREASDAVRSDPEAWATILDDHAKAAAKRLKEEGRGDLIPALAGMVTGLPYNHILYEAETAIVDGLYEVKKPEPLSIDRRAALRIVRPS